MYERGWGSCIRLELNYHIQKSNKSQAPWLVLVNGLFADLESYNEIVKLLVSEFNILRYDCRGQGKSPKPQSIYSLSDHVSDLTGLIEEVGLTEFSLIGLSNGARVALEFARINPIYVKGVVACDTYARPTEILKLKLNSWLKAFEKGGAYHRFDVATPWIWGESIVAKNPELVQFYRDRANNMEPHVVQGLILGAMEGEIPLKDILCPIHFIAGREDVLTPPYLHEDMFAEIGNRVGSKMTIVPGGHASILEYPQTVSTEILPFLRSLQ